MPSYVLVLKNDDYLILLENTAQGSESHTTLLGAHDPTPSHNRNIICSEKAVRELLLIAERFCPQVAVEISKQFERQRAAPNKPRPCY